MAEDLRVTLNHSAVSNGEPIPRGSVYTCNSKEEFERFVERGEGVPFVESAETPEKRSGKREVRG